MTGDLFKCLAFGFGQEAGWDQNWKRRHGRVRESTGALARARGGCWAALSWIHLAHVPKFGLHLNFCPASKISIDDISPAVGLTSNQSDRHICHKRYGTQTCALHRDPCRILVWPTWLFMQSIAAVRIQVARCCCDSGIRRHAPQGDDGRHS